MNFLRNLYEEVWATLMAWACAPAMSRLLSGRMYVLRSSPQWIVAYLAELSPYLGPQHDYDVVRLCAAAAQEKDLRQRRGEWK